MSGVLAAVVVYRDPNQFRSRQRDPISGVFATVVVYRNPNQFRSRQRDPISGVSVPQTIPKVLVYRDRLSVTWTRGGQTRSYIPTITGFSVDQT